ncbi:DUF7882 family protein [Leucobacter sp. USHLN153]|uniref:DUF7882 family protein n=1 Tax=Leucobacter sp. USHLN153 TaxID=3081268 RepID=UPI003015C413
MGYLMHGTHEYEFEDRLLTHLKMVIAQKLMKQEGFLLSWTKTAEAGSGRVSLWLSPFVQLGFRFSGGRPPELNRTWLRVLNSLSNTSRGLVVMSEDDAVKYAKQNPDLL